MNIVISPRFDEPMNKPFQSTNRSVQYVQLKQRQYRHHDFIVVAKIFDQITEVAHGSKQTMQQYQRLTLTFFDVPELILLFDFIFHCYCSTLLAKIIDLLQIKYPL